MSRTNYLFHLEVLKDTRIKRKYYRTSDLINWLTNNKLKEKLGTYNELNKVSD